MMRILFALTIFYASLATGASYAADATKRPANIVILLADDLGYADVGFHGNEDIPTPHLDALAASGVQFTSGYVSGPYCSPTRAGLLTGRYQQRFGHEFNPSNPQAGLPLSESTIADRLKAAGYKTGLIGKWHLGHQPEFHPQERGFDEFFGFLSGANSFLTDESTGNVPNILRGKEPAQEKSYLTDALGREAVDFVERHKAQPFFLFLSFNAVHTPMQADETRLAKFSQIKDPTRRTYAAMLSALDDAVGDVVEKLRAENLEDNTLIVFLSDNGGPTMATTTVNGAINTPLRGSKRQTLEGGIRVPLVVSWKGTLAGGRKYQAPVIQLDILPTALAAAGVEPDAAAKLDGVNLLPYLQGSNTGTPHEALFWRFGRQQAVRQGDWKLVRYGRTPAEIDETESWPKLYNLSQDIGETNDLADQHPEIVEQLQALWKTWDTQNVTPLWGTQRH